MDERIYTAAERHGYRSAPCPECGQLPELGWVNVGNGVNADQYRPNEKCRNRQCSLFRDPTSLAGG